MFPEKINVIGNAQSLFNKNYGEQIDKYPTVRFNYIENLKPQIQGTRWDYMATSDPKQIARWNKAAELPFHTFLFTIWAEKEKRHVTGDKYKGKSVYRIPDKIWTELNNINPRPSTGLSVLYLFDQLNIAEVNVYGFDFKETKSYYNSADTDNRQSSMHNYDQEKKYINQMIEKNNWNIF